MQTAKLFQNGRSQAVRLPKEFQFSGNDVIIRKVGEMVMLFPKNKAWETFLRGLDGFSDDFLAEGRQQPDEQKRQEL